MKKSEEIRSTKSAIFLQYLYYIPVYLYRYYTGTGYSLMITLEICRCTNEKVSNSFEGVLSFLANLANAREPAIVRAYQAQAHPGLTAYAEDICDRWRYKKTDLNRVTRQEASKKCGKASPFLNRLWFKLLTFLDRIGKKHDSKESAFVKLVCSPLTRIQC